MRKECSQREKTIKGYQGGLWKRFYQAGHHFSEREDAKYEKLNISNFIGWLFSSLFDPEKKIKADRKWKGVGSNGGPALRGQGT